MSYKHNPVYNLHVVVYDFNDNKFWLTGSNHQTVVIPEIVNQLEVNSQLIANNVELGKTATNKLLTVRDSLIVSGTQAEASAIFQTGLVTQG